MDLHTKDARHPPAPADVMTATTILGEVGWDMGKWMRRVEYAGRYGSFLRKADATVEVGFAGSTQSAGKPHTWGSGEADED